MNPQPLLTMKSISKSFPGVKALDDVDIHVDHGEIHFIVGENGAGKSTLMKVLSGIYGYGSYDGDIIFDGEVRRFTSINDSVNEGIVIINQELALFPNLSVYENIFIGHEIQGTKGLVDWDKTKAKAREYLGIVGLDVDIYRMVHSLGVGKQQLIEIAKALSQNVKLLILDEPTAALNENDSENLLNLLLELKQQGITSIMISHKLKEVQKVADSLTILRDGKTIIRINRDELNEQTTIKYMVGREIENIFPTRNAYQPQDVVLETIGLSAYDPNINRYLISDINLKLHRGEVVGIAGLMGAGRTEIAHTIFGNPGHYKVSGQVILNGEPVTFKHPVDAIKKGIAYVSEDRKHNGLILIDNIVQNITITDLVKISNYGIVDSLFERKEAKGYIDSIGIRTPSIFQQVKNLSGGNQQKVQIAKWLFAGPKILILDEPTRGIDVGAKFEIYTIINQLIDKGMSILIISSELPEILAMCDRIYVIAEGQQTGEFTQADATPEKIMERATIA
jgi:putative multiple sugar transport system ATP-binding protein